MKPKGLVVIATNNGKEHVQRLIRSMRDVGHSFKEWPVVIVDTGSSQEVIDYYKQVTQNSKGKIMLLQSPYGRDTGAYIYAYQSFVNVHRFIFMHDSMQVKTKGWADAFVAAERTKKGQASAWLFFPFFFDNPDQHKFVLDLYGKDSLVPDYGIFGPIFSTTRNVLKELEAKGYLDTYPDDKIQAQGFERGWMIGFNNLGFKVVNVEEALFNDSIMTNDGYTYLTKYRPGR